jgi:ribosomal protein L7/L12
VLFLTAYHAATILVMGIVAAIGLLILIAAGVVHLVLLVKTIRRDRMPVAAPRPVRAINPQTQARLAELAGQGKKIQAIKDLRAATGLGLKEAKSVADGLSGFQAGFPTN